MDISRKRFVGTLVGGSALLLFHGCGGGGSYNGNAAPPVQANGCTPNILDNHPQPHVLVISLSDLDSTTAKTYDIMGAADHTHSVTFSVAQLGQLKAGTMVSVTSTVTLAHSHPINVTCVVM
jgi:hypothetical protein